MFYHAALPLSRQTLAWTNLFALANGSVVSPRVVT
jgi:hypothetical protein